MLSVRIALGISYSGSSYEGWQSQLSRNTVQDKLELALTNFVAPLIEAGTPVTVQKDVPAAPKA